MNHGPIYDWISILLGFIFLGMCIFAAKYGTIMLNSDSGSPVIYTLKESPSGYWSAIIGYLILASLSFFGGMYNIYRRLK